MDNGCYPTMDVDRVTAVRDPGALQTLYRKRGLRLTPQRTAVFRALDGNDRHPNAEALYASVVAELPHVSLRTVYSILAELAALGEILQLDLGTGASRFDPNVEPHHHLVCESCGAVRDVLVDHPQVRPVSGDDGFSVTGTEIVFRGRCERCAEPAASLPKSPQNTNTPHTESEPRTCPL